MFDLHSSLPALPSAASAAVSVARGAPRKKTIALGWLMPDTDPDSSSSDPSIGSLEPSSNNSGDLRSNNSNSNNNNGNNNNSSLNITYDFVYSDCGTFEDEMNDFFSLADSVKQSEFIATFDSQKLDFFKGWSLTSETFKKKHIMCLLEALELKNADARLNAARELLYVSQEGVYVHQPSKEAQIRAIHTTNSLLFSVGAFPAFRKALRHVSEVFETLVSSEVLGDQSSTIDFANTETSVYLSLLFILVQTNISNSDFVKDCCECDAFDARSLMNPPTSGNGSGNGDKSNGYSRAKGNVPFAIELFDLVSVLAEANRKLYPVKKLLLLLWKVLHCTVGNSEFLKLLKDAGRVREGLQRVPKDTAGKSVPQDLHHLYLLTTKKYPAYVTPPITSIFPHNIIPDPLSTVARRTLLSGGMMAGVTQPVIQPLSPTVPLSADLFPVTFAEALNLIQSRMYVGMREAQTSKEMHELEGIKRRGGGESFDFGGASSANSKLKRSSSSCESLHSVALDDEQEEALERVEQLYRYLSPNVTVHIGMLIRLMYYVNLGNELTSKTEADNADINGGGKKLSEEEILESADVARHKEVITQAISAILLLLLKSVKCDQILKFEYLCQLLVDNNCPILVLKMLSTWFQNPVAATLATNTSAGADNGGVQERAELANSNAAGLSYGWLKERDDPKELENFHTTINLMRILQKITKRKTHRIMALVQWKASAVLKRIIKVPNIPVQIYALKLLKGQVPLMGKKWRSSNMKVITSIYLYLRPDLYEEYLSGDSDVDSDEALGQEQYLRSLIACFHHRVYPDIYPPPRPASQQQPSSTSIVDSKLPGSLAADEELESLLSGSTNINNYCDFVVTSAGMGYNRYAADVAAKGFALDDNFIRNYRDWLLNDVYEESDDENGTDVDTVVGGEDSETGRGTGYGIGEKQFLVVDEFDMLDFKEKDLRSAILADSVDGDDSVVFDGVEAPDSASPPSGSLLNSSKYTTESDLVFTEAESRERKQAGLWRKKSNSHQKSRLGLFAMGMSGGCVNSPGSASSLVGSNLLTPVPDIKLALSALKASSNESVSGTPAQRRRLTSATASNVMPKSTLRNESTLEPQRTSGELQECPDLSAEAPVYIDDGEPTNQASEIRAPSATRHFKNSKGYCEQISQDFRGSMDSRSAKSGLGSHSSLRDPRKTGTSIVIRNQKNDIVASALMNPELKHAPSNIRSVSPSIKSASGFSMDAPFGEMRVWPSRLSSLATQKTKDSILSVMIEHATKAKYNIRGSLASVENTKDGVNPITIKDLLFHVGLNPMSSISVNWEFFMSLMYFSILGIIPMIIGFDLSINWSYSAILTGLFACDILMELVTFRSADVVITARNIPYATIVGTVSAIAMGVDASGRLYKQKIDELNDYMRWKDLSEMTRRKALKYYEIKYRGKYFEEATLLNEMNDSLRMEITTHNCRQLISKVPFLKREVLDGRDELFLGRIAAALSPCYYVAGDVIVTAGDVRYLTATVQAISSCTLYKLKQADFMRILPEFEDMKERIREIYEERMAKAELEAMQRELKGQNQ
ncbi:Factor arrest protein 11 [Entophlyctis luteolus]|nr:Factor arrest protein 11 [Entophlyctis luteolus]